MSSANGTTNGHGATSASTEKNEGIVNSSRSDPDEAIDVTNEYVLNFAFVSFVLFTLLQFIFALTARSQSMLTDCAAMTVDCVSYFINFISERLKSRPAPKCDPKTGQRLSAYERHYRKKMRLLILELVPPLLSVSTLVVVTIIAIDQALCILLDKDPDDKGAPPDLFLMLLFSALNFVLDGVNVLCFARADKKNGLMDGLTAVMHPQEYTERRQSQTFEQSKENEDNQLAVTENTNLLPKSPKKDSVTVGLESDEDDLSSQSSRGLNLNMCSAWTHVCADTLRSIAVLIAAGFAFLFPSILTPADADSYGAIVVSIIIIISLGPLFEGLYFTAWDIYYLYDEHRKRAKAGQLGDPMPMAMAV